MRLNLLCAAFALSVCGCASAKPAETPKSGNVKIDALQADIVAGKREDALAKIDEVESISGRPLPVSNPTEFIDALKDCTVSGYGDVMETRNHWLVHTVWACPSGKIDTFLATLDHHEKVTIGDFKAQQ